MAHMNVKEKKSLIGTLWNSVNYFLLNTEEIIYPYRLSILDGLTKLRAVLNIYSLGHEHEFTQNVSVDVHTYSFK